MNLIILVAKLGIVLLVLPARVALAQGIDTLALAAHASVLAHDSLGGRANDSPGGLKAVAYIESQFRRLGLEPAGENGGYRQAVPLGRIDVDPGRTRLIVRREGGADTIPARQFHHMGGDTIAFRPFTGALKFAGSFGQAITLVSGGESVAGDVVVASPGGGSVDSLAALLEPAGAAALLVVVPDSQRYATLRNARGPTRYALRGERIPGVFGGRLPVILVGPAGGTRLGPGPTGRRDVRLEIAAHVREATAFNVLARLPGSDASLRGEHVAFVAHHDHIGHAEPVNGDSLYNGFIDNAVGVAAVLGIAEAMRTRPASRSVLFFLAGTEEQGSLGSAYWVRRPTVRGLVGAINLDAGAPLRPPSSWIVEGGDASPLGRAALAVAREAGWTAEPAPLQPTSDHWSFSQAGIPAVFLVPGEKWEGVSDSETEALIARWWRAHRPDDEWSPEFPLGGLRRYAEYAMRIAYSIP